MESGTFVFNLSKELRYHSKGDANKMTASLEFISPGMAVYDQIVQLSQSVMGAIMDSVQYAAGNVESKNDETPQDTKSPDAKAIKMILFSSKNIKFTTIANQFREVAKMTGTMDGEEKIKDAVLNKLSIEDLNNLICEYISFFIAPSLF